MCFCFVMFLNVVVVSVVIWVRLCCLSCLGIVLFLSFERLSIWLVRLSRCLFCCCILARVLVFVFCCLVFIFCSGLSSRVSGVWNLWLMFVKKLDFSLFSFCRWLVFVCWNLSFSVVCWVFFCCCLCQKKKVLLSNRNFSKFLNSNWLWWLVFCFNFSCC